MTESDTSALWINLADGTTVFVWNTKKGAAAVREAVDSGKTFDALYSDGHPCRVSGRHVVRWSLGAGPN
jgi:hypothetical protein